MKRFSSISSEAFASLQLEAGMLLNKFNPESPTVPADEDIICATDGGINPKCTPNYIDYGEGIDNCPENTAELKDVDSWDCSMACTCKNVTAETVALALGPCDISGNKIMPRQGVKQEDFKDIWWVGDLSDGGFAAVHLIKALSADGLSMQSKKKGTNDLAINLQGHYTIANTSVVPMEFYVAKAE